LAANLAVSLWLTEWEVKISRAAPFLKAGVAFGILA